MFPTQKLTKKLKRKRLSLKTKEMAKRRRKPLKRRTNLRGLWGKGDTTLSTQS